MPIRPNKSHLLVSLLLGLSLFCNTMVIAQDQAASTFNMAEFQQILDSIDQSNLPDSFKDQLFRDMKASLIENVRQAEIPEGVKRTLIKDLENTTR
jgi:hypothetical protein